MKLALKFMSLLAIAGGTLLAPRVTNADNVIPGTAAIIAVGTIDVATFDGTPLVGPSILNLAYFGPEGFGNPGWFGSVSLTNNGTTLFQMGPGAPGFAGVHQAVPGLIHAVVLGTILHKGQVLHVFITFWSYNGNTDCHINLLLPGVGSVLQTASRLTGFVLLDE